MSWASPANKYKHSIWKLANLQELDLSGGELLKRLPVGIGQLINLQKLDLRGCEKLTTLPDSIGQLVNLQELDLSHCTRLTNLPNSIGRIFPNLHKLSMTLSPQINSFEIDDEFLRRNSKRNPELEASILSNPEENGAWSVYGDWLQTQGDPRGEMVALGLALNEPKKTWRPKWLTNGGNAQETKRTRAREIELFQTHKHEWLGPSVLIPKLSNFSFSSGPLDELSGSKDNSIEWKYGFIHAVRFHWEEEGYWGKKIENVSLHTLLKVILENPSCIFLHELVIQWGSSMDDVDAKELLAPLLNNENLPNLRILRLQNFSEQMDMIVRETLKSPLFPGLTTLEFSGGGLTAAGTRTLLRNAGNFGHLEKLDIKGNQLKKDRHWQNEPAKVTVAKLRKELGKRLVADC